MIAPGENLVRALLRSQIIAKAPITAISVTRIQEKLDYEAKLTVEIDKRHENQLPQAREENHIGIVAVEHSGGCY